MSKKDEVLKAAISCFGTFGYHKTTMSDIGNKVGMNKALLYYHYKDKLALYEAVIQYLRQDHILIVQTLIDQEVTLQDKIICFLKGELDFLSQITVSYLHGSIPINDESKTATEFIIRDDVIKLSSMIDEGIKQQVFEMIDSHQLAVQIVKVVQGLLLVNCPLYMPDDERKEGYNQAKTIAEDVVRLLLKGIEI